MPRPKNKIKREKLNTTISEQLIELVRKISDDTGVPINRLIEDALREKYDDV